MLQGKFSTQLTYKRKLQHDDHPQLGADREDVVNSPEEQQTAVLAVSRGSAQLTTLWPTNKRRGSLLRMSRWSRRCLQHFYPVQNFETSCSFEN